jgi:hypothetical protein
MLAAERWQSHLNIHHLFEARGDAATFALESDKRVPEHSPLFGVGLWELR